MFPSAHTACSHTFWWGEWRSLKNNGTASTQTERDNERRAHTRRSVKHRTNEVKTGWSSRGKAVQTTYWIWPLPVSAQTSLMQCWSKPRQLRTAMKDWRRKRERQASSDVFEVAVNNTSPLDHSEYRVTFCETLNWTQQDFPTEFCVCSQYWPLKNFSLLKKVSKHSNSSRLILSHDLK